MKVKRRMPCNRVSDGHHNAFITILRSFILTDAFPRNGKCITNESEAKIFSCQPNPKSLVPENFSYATFPIKHTTLGLYFSIASNILLLPIFSSPLLNVDMSTVGLFTTFKNPYPYFWLNLFK